MEEKKETRREAAAVPVAQGAPAEPEHGGAVGRLLSGERPESLSGLKGVWLAMSCAGALCVLLSLLFALFWSVVWACVFAAAAILIFLASNFWFRERVTSPILGLGDTARHIADGSYGTLAERLRDDEIGALTDAINDMSVKIGKADRVQSEFISVSYTHLTLPTKA